MKKAATKKALVRAMVMAVTRSKGEGRPILATNTVRKVRINKAIPTVQSCFADAT
jgi:hypothetical protein